MAENNEIALPSARKDTLLRHCEKVVTTDEAISISYTTHH